MTTTRESLPGTPSLGPADATDHARPVDDVPGRRRLRRVAVAVVVVVVVVGLMVATAVAALHRREDAAVAAAHREVGPSAAEAATAVLSYQPESVDADLGRARSHLGGEFATYFDTLGREVVRPAASQRHMGSTATVTGTSVVSAGSDDAVALVFVNQVTTADDLTQPTTTPSSLRLELHKTEGHWLVTKLDTV